MARTAQHGWPAAVIAAYAVSIGTSVRTAQRHASAGHADFLRFAQVQAGENISRSSDATALSVPPPVDRAAAAQSPPSPPPEVTIDDEHLSETGRMLKASWSMWAEHYRQWQFCRGGHKDRLGLPVSADHPMMCVHAKLIMELRKDYDKALGKHQQWQIDNRRLIPANEFHAFRSGFLIPLRNMLKNMPAEAAPLVNPKDQQQAIRGGIEYLHQRLNPQIERALIALDALVPAIRLIS